MGFVGSSTGSFKRFRNGAVSERRPFKPGRVCMRLDRDRVDPASGVLERDFHANVGHVKQTLEEDYLYIFDRPPALDIYTDNVILRDGNNFKLQGKDTYSTCFWLLRFHGHLLFRKLKMDVTSLYFIDDLLEIRIRWRVSGKFRMPDVAMESTDVVFDGMSTYRLNEHGIVCEHDLDHTLYRPRENPVLVDGLMLYPAVPFSMLVMPADDYCTARGPGAFLPAAKHTLS
ncbi:hypothetical protein NDN08_003859 [Rhodosorus marinus]|uniref:Uncharacterized protein n=1 Tax=Rhodosorus marinus TaxID=101924 RepID=A0AAV8UJY8_9RHOD|nr:hypothetical protein NDN08_003859 [Rhodosorus marinus]